MNTPLVSVIIPAYNTDKFIEWTINSVLNQTYRNFECIIVNDFSTDNTKKKCLNLFKKDCRVKILTHRANSGLSATRNTGLRFASGKYICFLDSDDLMMSDSLEVRVKTLENNKELSVIGTYCGSLNIDQECEKAPASQQVNLKKIDFITAGANCPFNANQPMFITDSFKRLGGFDHSLKQAEDYDMWIRMLRKGYIILPTNVQAVTYRATEGSMIKKNPLLHLDASYKCFISCYDDLPLEDLLDKSLNKGLPFYIRQLNIAWRTLEFCGIEMARSDNNNYTEIIIRIKKYLPDYFKIIEPHRNFQIGFLKGVNRFFAKDITKDIELFKKYKKKINIIYIKLKLDLTKKERIATHYKLINDNSFNVFFIPHKDYHVSTIGLMKPYLDKFNIKFLLIDISMHYRDEGVQTEAKKLKLPLIGWSQFSLGSYEPKVLISFNDWDPIVRSLFVSAQRCGIKTVSIVEGVQDYTDADTKQNRNAYGTADYIFLPSEFDKKYFRESRQNLCVVGVPRIYSMRKTTPLPLPNTKTALINSNFSYGVLEDKRDQWLSQAVDACYSAGYIPVISRHPADLGKLYPELVTKNTFYNATNNSDVVINRFASGMLESLAMGRPVIYFNPHNEEVEKFKDPLDSYSIVNYKDKLVSELLNIKSKRASYLKNSNKFLDFHTGNMNTNSSSLCVESITKIVFDHNVYINCYDKFNSYLSFLDRITGCFSKLDDIRKINASYSDVKSNSFDDLLKTFNFNESENKNISLNRANSLIRKGEHIESLYIYMELVKKNTNFKLYKVNFNNLFEKSLRLKLNIPLELIEFRESDKYE